MSLLFASQTVDNYVGARPSPCALLVTPRAGARVPGALLMSAAAFVSLGVLIVVLLACIGPLGRYMAKVYGERQGARRSVLPAGRAAHVPHPAGRPEAGAALEHLRDVAPRVQPRLGPRAVPVPAGAGVAPARRTASPTSCPKMAFNTAVSFVTNTNWQSYAGESTMGHLVQMAGLAVQNFVSAAVGMASWWRSSGAWPAAPVATLGNFWVDLTRTTIRILLPISFVIALVLVSQGAIQNFTPHHDGHDRRPDRAGGRPSTTAANHGRSAGDRAADPRWAVGQPGGDQGARHQRWRVLQRQLGPSVREPDPALRTCWRSTRCWSSASPSPSPTG